MVGRLRGMYLFPLFALVVALAYYGPFLNNFFAFDDFRYLENMYRDWSSILTGYGTLRLVSNLTWWPLFAVSGLAPFAYNALSLAFFIANAVLLYFLLDELLADRAAAFLASAFFVAGSVGVDAVFWKATNSSLISCFFYLSALICYCRFRRSARPAWYRGALALFLVAMFSKEEAASLPLVLALVEVLFFEGWQDRRNLVRRLIPFCCVVPVYLAANALVFNFLMGAMAEPQHLFRLRPLYSLIGGATSFYLSPKGFIDTGEPGVYFTALLIPLSFLFKRQRRLVWFGYGWIFLVFLPMSLTGLGEFEPRHLVNSISRYLYITSIGAALIFAAVLTGIRELLPAKLWYAVAGGALLFFVAIHYPRVRERGEQWQQEGQTMAEFLVQAKKAVPAFPAPSYLLLLHRPVGQSFTQQALRAWYGNPRIEVLRKNVLDDPTFAGPVYLLDCWKDPDMKVDVRRVR